MPLLIIILITTLASCATLPPESASRGKPVVSSSISPNCFGLNTPIYFFASETFGAGYFGGDINVSTLLGFGFRDEILRKVIYAKISLDSTIPVVKVRFLDSLGKDAAQIARYKNPRIIECGENRTEISFTNSFAGDGVRVNRLITLTFAQDKEFVRVDSKREGGYCTMLLFCGDEETKKFSGNFKPYDGKR